MTEQVLSRPEPRPEPRSLPRTGVQDAPQLKRGAIASIAFLTGWLPISCCSLGLTPAIMTGLGLGTAYFAMGNHLMFGLGWTPVWALVAIGIVLIASLVLSRPVFAAYPREVSTRYYWRTAGYMLLASGLVFILWMEVIMPVLFILGVPMGALFPKQR